MTAGKWMNEWILYLYTIVRSAKLVGSCVIQAKGISVWERSVYHLICLTPALHFSFPLCAIMEWIYMYDSILKGWSNIRYVDTASETNCRSDLGKMSLCHRCSYAVVLSIFYIFVTSFLPLATGKCTLLLCYQYRTEDKPSNQGKVPMLKENNAWMFGDRIRREEYICRFPILLLAVLCTPEIASCSINKQLGPPQLLTDMDSVSDCALSDIAWMNDQDLDLYHGFHSMSFRP